MVRPVKPPPITLRQPTVKRSAHVVMGNNSARCLNCGEEQAIAMPCSIPVFIAICKAFAGEHSECAPPRKR